MYNFSSRTGNHQFSTKSRYLICRGKEASRNRAIVCCCCRQYLNIQISGVNRSPSPVVGPSFDRCIQTQVHLDRQIVENKNLQALIDSQNKTIESLTNRLTVLESNYGFRSSESPDPGLFHQSLDELNNFSPAIPVDTGPGIGPGFSRGVLIIAVDTNIPALLVSLSLPPSEVEVLIVKLWVIPNSSSPLTIVNLYSPRGKFDAHWLDSVISHLSPPFLILGDFNVHHPALGSLFSSSDASKVLDWINANNMCLLNMSQFTRFQTGHAPSLLDLSICSADIYNNISVKISHDTYDSDHCLILMS
ncbi:hypothetical protein AVEN_7919-1 [Araneus ventricosus]|uniref:Endonuclease/exonuclease/phosphatase domain-containing protein n=1 Tax=Araneus ventricosus TaxID=182803 RepID=A0A4Y2D3D3_ARAVE|nr:hypothetical protein AVEN_7919-1 [Araneus ventricosus]